MKLWYSNTSPYVRKVMAVIKYHQLDDQIQLQTIQSSFDPHSPHNQDNPLGRVPALQLDNGEWLYNSHSPLSSCNAGTSHPMTALRAIGPEPMAFAYVQPSRRPTDGRYGENPNRLQHYYQFQVVIKPSPDNIQELYLGSLKMLGFDPTQQP